MGCFDVILLGLHDFYHDLDGVEVLGKSTSTSAIALYTTDQHVGPSLVTLVLALFDIARLEPAMSIEVLQAKDQGSIAWERNWETWSREFHSKWWWYRV